MTFPDGSMYEGEFKDGEYNGQGIMTFPDGNKYVGEFKDGKRHGQGTFTFSDGRKYLGEWREKKPWNGTLVDKDGKIIEKYVYGVKQ